jgi:hypothetical protein
MTINQRFQLSNSGPNSSLKMKIALRVLCHLSWDAVVGGKKKKAAAHIAAPSPN